VLGVEVEDGMLGAMGLILLNRYSSR
jgi:hypothetical protein